MSRKHVTSVLTDAATHYFVRKLYSVHSEFGVGRRGRRRLDLLCMNTKMEFIGVEVKSCKADYVSDKKWSEYLPYVNKMYLMLPPKVLSSNFYQQILKDIQPYGMGIMSLKEDGTVYVVKSARRKEVDSKVAQSSLIKIVWRLGVTCRDVSRRKRKFKL